MDNDKIQLTNEHETYLSTLYGKALDSRSADPILGDTYADEAIRRIDFDFEKLKLASGGTVSLPVRAKHLDGWAREFLATHDERDRSAPGVWPRQPRIPHRSAADSPLVRRRSSRSHRAAPAPLPRATTTR